MLQKTPILFHLLKLTQHDEQQCLSVHILETADFMERNPQNVKLAKELLMELWELAQRLVNQRQRQYAGWAHRTSHNRGRILFWQWIAHLGDSRIPGRYCTNASVAYFV